MRPDKVTMPLYTRPIVVSSPLWRRLWRLFLLLALAALYGVGIAYLPLQLIAVPIIPIILLLLLSLWMLPDQATLPERALQTTFTWFIVLYYVWPSYIAIALPGLPWFSAGRLALLVLMVVALYCLSTSNKFRTVIIETAKASRVIWSLFLVGLVAQLMPTFFNASPISIITRLINDQMYWTAPFLIGCYVFRQPGRTTHFIKTMVTIITILSLFGLLERYQQGLFWAGHIPSFLKIDDDKLFDVVFSSQMRDYIGTYRVHSTFAVSLIYAELLVLILPFIIHGIVIAKTFRLKLLLTFIWLIVGLNIFFTDSRLGKIGFIIAHFGYALMWAVRYRQRIASFGATAVTFAIPAVVALGVGLIFASRRLHALVFGSEGYAGSSDARVDQIAMGIPKILHNPLGYGAGTAGRVLGYRIPGGQLTIDSQFLKTALEFGVVGMVAIYGLFVWATWLAVRIYFGSRDSETDLAGPTALLLVNYVVIRSVLAEDYNNTLGYLAVAIVVALLIRHRELQNTLYTKSLRR